MIEGTLTAKKSNDDPIVYRVVFDDGSGGLEVGSISFRTRHTGERDRYWHWGIDTMPLIAGHKPNGESLSLEAALTAFRESFMTWVNSLHPGDWQRNRDYKRAAAERRPRP